MNEDIWSTSSPMHSVHLNTIGLSSTLHVELIGRHMVDIPKTCAEQHLVTLSCIHTEGRAPIIPETIREDLLDSDALRDARYNATELN